VASERNANGFVTELPVRLRDFWAPTRVASSKGRSATPLTLDFAAHGQDWGGPPGPGRRGGGLRIDQRTRTYGPWILAAQPGRRHGALRRVRPATAELDLDGLASLSGARTRLVAVTVRPTCSPMPRSRGSQLAHDRGALLYVDGVHYAGIGPGRPRSAGADFLVCAPVQVPRPACAVARRRQALLETIVRTRLLPSTTRWPKRFESAAALRDHGGATAAVECLDAMEKEERQERSERRRKTRGPTKT